MTTTTKLTLEEFLKMRETKPGNEYVDGEVLQKSLPTLAHGIIQYLVALVVGLYLRSNPIGVAGTEISCIFGPAGQEVARLPDFLFVAAARLAGARGDEPFHGAPDLAVEILSPEDRMSDMMAKVRSYLLHSVHTVWVIDPEARTVMVMTSPAAIRILAEDETLDGGDVLPGFSTPARDILPPPGLPAAEPVTPNPD